MGWNFFWMGHAAAGLKKSDEMIVFGKKQSQTRSNAQGYVVKGNCYNEFGDFASAETAAKQSISEAIDPFYKSIPITTLVYSYILQNKFKQAEECLSEYIPIYKKNGDMFLYPIAALEQGVVMIGSGKMAKGYAIIKEVVNQLVSQKRVGLLPLFYLSIGRIYLEIILKTQPISPGTIMKNIGFILKNAPFAFKKARFWYGKAIALSEELGATGIKGQSLLDIGLIYKAKKQNDNAKMHLEEAITLFEEVGALAYLKKAKKELDELNQ